jgi:hypothetical protein
VYNIVGSSVGIYCVAHKTAEMINVKDKTCRHEGCNTIPYYNIAGSSVGIYCAIHKTAEMINVVSKTCQHEMCNKQPVFNIVGSSVGIYCVAHKTADMVDVVNKTCKSEWCSTRVNNNKYDGYCLFCYMHLFPDKPVSRNYKTKEYAVVEHIKTQFCEYQWVADRVVSGGCSRRRPDLMLDLLTQVIIVEIDENQHRDYDCSCQNKRIMELSQDMDHRPIVFIRFNPDEYETDSGTNITSCWGQNKHGICVVKRSKTDEWTQRLQALDDQIRYWTDANNTTDKTVEIVQLFYDGYQLPSVGNSLTQITNTSSLEPPTTV